jgi:hypothetical protein
MNEFLLRIYVSTDNRAIERAQESMPTTHPGAQKVCASEWKSTDLSKLG